MPTIYFYESFGWANVGAHDPAVAGEDLKLRYAGWRNNGLEIGDWGDPVGHRKYLRSTGGRQNLQPRTTLPDLTSFVIGFTLRHTGFNDGTILGFFGAGSLLAHLGIRNDNRLSWSLDTGGRPAQDVVGATDAPVPINVQTFVEVEVTLDSSVGTLDWYLNGVLDASQSGVDTTLAGTLLDAIELLWGSTALSADNPHSGIWIGDIYIADTRLGPRRSFYAPADSPGSAANHTPSGSPTNHECVDEVDGHDGDGTHVAGTGVKDSLGISFATTLPVEAVQAIAAARGEAGPETIQVGILSGATEVLGPATGVSTDYEGGEGDVHETNPDTAAAWVPADLGNVEVVLQS